MRIVTFEPSSSGKSNLLVTLLTDDRFYKNKFETNYWRSPTARIVPSLDVMREYVKNHSKQDQEEDPTFNDKIDIPFLQSKVDRQKKVTAYLKKTKSQQGFNMINILDDLADIKRGLPTVSKFVDSLLIKARHWNVSVILSKHK